MLFRIRSFRREIFAIRHSYCRLSFRCLPHRAQCEPLKHTQYTLTIHPHTTPCARHFRIGIISQSVRVRLNVTHGQHESLSTVGESFGRPAYRLSLSSLSSCTETRSSAFASHRIERMFSGFLPARAPSRHVIITSESFAPCKPKHVPTKNKTTIQ